MLRPQPSWSSRGAIIAHARGLLVPRASSSSSSSTSDRREWSDVVPARRRRPRACRPDVVRLLSSSSSSSSPAGIDIPPRLSVAIVGSGPSGLYAAKYLMSSVSRRVREDAEAKAKEEVEEEDGEEDDDDGGTTTTSGQIGRHRRSRRSFGWSGVDVDVIERLPTPYGLVRYGVAPDHPEVKNVEREYASMFDAFGSDYDVFHDDHKEEDDDDDDGAEGRRRRAMCTLSYFGNVDVGKDVSLSYLESMYDVVVLAYGCQSSEKRLGVPGEDVLDGVLGAREFVAWYNGHPEFDHVGKIVRRCLLPQSSSKSSSSGGGKGVSPARVVVIGQGNVALDVARVLVKGGKGLIDTDMPNSVMEILGDGVSSVTVVGRRGHVQGSFTIKELRELTRLKDDGHDASFVVRNEELDLGMTESSISELKSTSGRPKTRIDKLLREVATSNDDAISDTAKLVELRFLMNPIRFEPNDRDGDRVGRVIFERTNLVGDPFDQKSIGTNVIESMPADLVLVSIGYRGMPLEGMEEGVFDDRRGVVANVHGKVAGENNLFVTGWIKRGPSGIIGTNISDAKETVASVMEYIDSVSRRRGSSGRVGLAEILQRPYVSWPRYLKIDAAETDRGRLRNDAQPREKLLTVDEMLKAAFEA